MRKDETVKLLQFDIVVVSGPQPEFDDVAGLEAAGSGQDELVHEHFGIEVQAVAADVFRAIQCACKMAVHGIRKFPLGNVLVLLIGIGGIQF